MSLWTNAQLSVRSFHRVYSDILILVGGSVHHYCLTICVSTWEELMPSIVLSIIPHSPIIYTPTCFPYWWQQLLQQGRLKVNTSGFEIRILIAEKFFVGIFISFVNDFRLNHYVIYWELLYYLKHLHICQGTGKDWCNQKQNPKNTTY